MARNSIKEVNGIKVVKRYSAGSIFSGLICFFYPIIAVLFLVLPWMILESTSGAYFGIRMIDTIQSVTSSNIGTPFLDSILVSAIDPTRTFSSDIAGGGMILKAFDISGFALWLCLAIFSAFLLFFALEYLFRGKVTHFKVPFVISIFASICVVLLGAICLTQNLLFTFLFNAQTNQPITFTGYWLIVYIAMAVFGTIALIIIYNLAFKNKVFIGDLGDLSHLTGDAELGEDGRIKYTTKEVVKVRYEPAIGLPPRLSSIGGHAFSQNMNLVVAMIPNGIKSIGQGAFANCGRLKIVSIPLSVKSISFNAFFNCANLQRINYAGTKEQWRHIKRGSNWLTKAGTYTVVCADGAIIVNPYH